jgi:hippurate hydrolase
MKVQCPSCSQTYNIPEDRLPKEKIVGDANVEADRPAEMGAEDFSYMLEQRPGAYVFLGAGPGAGLHHPEFDYNDEASPFGASWFVRLVEIAQPLNR